MGDRTLAVQLCSPRGRQDPRRLLRGKRLQDRTRRMGGAQAVALRPPHRARRSVVSAANLAAARRSRSASKPASCAAKKPRRSRNPCAVYLGGCYIELPEQQRHSSSDADASTSFRRHHSPTPTHLTLDDSDRAPPSSSSSTPRRARAGSRWTRDHLAGNIDRLRPDYVFEKCEGVPLCAGDLHERVTPLRHLDKSEPPLFFAGSASRSREFM